MDLLYLISGLIALGLLVRPRLSFLGVPEAGESFMKFLNGGAKQATSRYPIPDRSSFQPKVNRIDPIYEIDLGWAEDEFRDARPYRAEHWLWDHLLFITFFFSTIALDKFSKEGLFALLEEEGLIRFTGEKQGVAEKLKDCSEEEIWSVSVTLRGREGALASTGIRFTPYRLDWSLDDEKDLAGMELPRLASGKGEKS
jgi:hypothetical protein